MKLVAFVLGAFVALVIAWFAWLAWFFRKPTRKEVLSWWYGCLNHRRIEDCSVLAFLMRSDGADDAVAFLASAMIVHRASVGWIAGRRGAQESIDRAWSRLRMDPELLEAFELQQMSTVAQAIMDAAVERGMDHDPILRAAFGLDRKP